MFSRIGICTVTVLLMGTGDGLAQSVDVGIKGGVTSTNVSISSSASELEDTSARAGFVGGLYAGFGIGRYFSIQPEVLYSQKGFKYVGDVGELNAKLDYLEVPVLFRVTYDVGEAGDVAPTAYVGASVGFEVSCKLSNQLLNLSCPDLPGEVLNVSRKKTDFSTVFGGGLDINLDLLVVVLDVRYNLGLTNLLGSAFETTAKNRAWYFMAGAGIPLGS